VPPGRRPRVLDRRGAREAEGLTMQVSVSAAVLLGVLVWLLWRYANLRAWHVALCVLFGFCLTSTTSGPHIADALQAAARLVSTLHL
jgi:hypothetical protein